MKRLLISAAAIGLFVSQASAADLIRSQPPVFTTPVSAVDWTGFYIGAVGAIGTGDSSVQIGPTSGPAAFDLTGSAGGFLGGAQVGADFQTGQFVFGGVADIAATNIGSTLKVGPVGGPTLAEIKSRVDYLATLRVRAGVDFDNTLLYAHGGVAFGHVTPTISLGGSALTGINAVNQTGYTVGLGLQYKITDNVSLQTEYAYTDLGRATVYNSGGTKATLDTHFHTVKAGVNFHF